LTDQRVGRKRWPAARSTASATCREQRSGQHARNDVGTHQAPLAHPERARTYQKHRGLAKGPNAYFSTGQ